MTKLVLHYFDKNSPVAKTKEARNLYLVQALPKNFNSNTSWDIWKGGLEETAHQS